MQAMRNTVAKGFTLVEILIVVVILGILAAIVVPQFTNAANDARQGNVETQTSTLQNQIELFAAQNSGAYQLFLSFKRTQQPAVLMAGVLLSMATTSRSHLRTHSLLQQIASPLPRVLQQTARQLTPKQTLVTALRVGTTTQRPVTSVRVVASTNQTGMSLHETFCEVGSERGSPRLA